MRVPWDTPTKMLLRIDIWLTARMPYRGQYYSHPELSAATASLTTGSESSVVHTPPTTNTRRIRAWHGIWKEVRRGPEKHTVIGKRAFDEGIKARTLNTRVGYCVCVRSCAVSSSGIKSGDQRWQEAFTGYLYHLFPFLQTESDRGTALFRGERTSYIDNCCIDSALSGSGGSLPHDILRVPCPRGCRNLGTVGSDAQTAGQSETNYIIASMSPVFPSHSLFPLLPSFLFSHPNHGQLAESRYNRPRAQCVGSFRSLLSLFP